MGSSSSHANTKDVPPILQSDRTKFENLIYENDHLSFRSSEIQGTSQTSRQQKSIQSNQKNQKTQKEQSVYSNSNKKQIREQSGMSNFDKLTMKSQRISQLNDILNDEIKVFNKKKKQQIKLGKNDENQLLHRIADPQRKSQNNHRPRRKRTQTQSLILGIWIGITISIFVVLVIIVQINNLSIANQSNFSRDFPTWRGIAIWIFYVWMLGFDISMYNKFRIRYREIFKIKPDHYPSEVSIYRIAGFHSSVFVILFLLYVLDVAKIYTIPGFQQEYFALISWGLFATFLFLPLPLLSNKGRYFVFGLILDSILSPFKGVTFPVTWLTDQAVSMAIPLKDLQYTICYYTEMDYNSSVNVCQDSNRISTVMIVAVSICSIRIIQCIRQGYDKGEYFMTPFFFNTLKYLATLLTAIFAFYYKLGADDIQAAWLLFAVISSFYSFMWDLMMDWDLLQKNKINPLLRQKLIFGSPRIYYLIIVGNFVMRLAWIMTISPKLAAFLGNNNLVFLITGMIQIFRRGIWNLLRVQKEHIALISQPIKSQIMNSNALQLERKLATVQNTLNLQIKMLKFFKKFEQNRQSLNHKLNHQPLNEQNLQNHNLEVENYNKNFQQVELKEISQLLKEMLKSDSFLKKKLQEQEIKKEVSEKQPAKLFKQQHQQKIKGDNELQNKNKNQAVVQKQVNQGEQNIIANKINDKLSQNYGHKNNESLQNRRISVQKKNDQIRTGEIEQQTNI